MDTTRTIGADAEAPSEGLKTWSTELEQVARELAARPLGTPFDLPRLVEAIARDVAARRRERRSGEAPRFRPAEAG